jgi:hypothetical protein
MLAVWAAEGHPQYQADEGSILYISDVGAHLKPLFISTPTSSRPISASLRALEYGLTFSDMCDHGTGVCIESGD